MKMNLTTRHWLIVVVCSMIVVSMIVGTTVTALNNAVSARKMEKTYIDNADRMKRLQKEKQREIDELRLQLKRQQLVNEKLIDRFDEISNRLNERKNESDEINIAIDLLDDDNLVDAVDDIFTNNQISN